MEIATALTRRLVIVIAAAFVVLGIACVLADVGKCSVAGSYINHLGTP